VNGYLSRPIDELEVSVRVARCLERLGVKTVGELIQKSKAELLREPNFGRRSMHELELILEDLGLSLRPGRFQPQDQPMSDKLRKIKPQPGHQIDWNGGDPVIRNAKGMVIARDLHITDQAFEFLKAEFEKQLLDPEFRKKLGLPPRPNTTC
jgi:hypothetical protein